MTLGEHLRAIRRYGVLIVVVVIVGAALGAGYALTRAQAYQSSVRLAIGPASIAGVAVTSTVASLENASIPATLAEIASSGSLHASAASAAKATSTPISTDAIVSNNSNVVQIKVKAPSATEAINVAGQTATLATKAFTNLYPLFTVTTIDSAHEAASTRPSKALAGVLGGVVGLLIGYLIALAAAAASRDRFERAGSPSGRSTRRRLPEQSNGDDADTAPAGHGTLA
jgi:capsular polysaccharide biosynthesis protein